MRLAHMAFLFALIALPSYMLGYPSPALGALMNEQGGPASFDSVLSYIASHAINTTFAIQVFGLALGISALTGFSAVYIIPVLILSCMVNLVLIPVSSIPGTGGVDMVSLLLGLFLNMIVFLGFMEYIRGGG